MGNPGLATEQEIGATTGGRERRKQPRFECDGWAEVIVSNACFLFRGKISDFSLTGCYIRSSAQLRLKRGANVELRFYVDGEHFSAEATIMSVRPGAGAGFEFLSDDPDLKGRLMRLIDKLNTSALALEEIAEQYPSAEEDTGPRRNLW